MWPRPFTTSIYSSYTLKPIQTLKLSWFSQTATTLHDSLTSSFGQGCDETKENPVNQYLFEWDFDWLLLVECLSAHLANELSNEAFCIFPLINLSILVSNCRSERTIQNFTCLDLFWMSLRTRHTRLLPDAFPTILFRRDLDLVWTPMYILIFFINSKVVQSTSFTNPHTKESQKN